MGGYSGCRWVCSSNNLFFLRDTGIRVISLEWDQGGRSEWKDEWKEAIMK